MKKINFFALLLILSSLASSWAASSIPVVSNDGVVVGNLVPDANTNNYIYVVVSGEKNIINLNQVGNHNRISGSFNGNSDLSSISEFGDYNTVELDLKSGEMDGFNLVQTGNHNSFFANISGSYNDIKGSQNGENHFSKILILGEKNILTLEQLGMSNTAIAVILGNNNNAGIAQEGSYSNATITILGSNNTATIFQK